MTGVCAPASSTTLVIQNQEFTESLCCTLSMICCPLKLRQWHFGCSPEHRMCPMDFVSALRGVLNNTVPAGRVCDRIT